MSRFRNPLAVRVVLWVIVLAIVPLLIVFGFMRQQARNAFLQARLDTLDNQARLYQARLQTQPGHEQEMTTVVTALVPGTRFFLLDVNGKYLANSDASKVGQSAINDFGTQTATQLLARQTAELTDPSRDLLISSYRQSLTDPVAVSVTTLSTRLAPFDQLTQTLLYRLSLGLLAVALAAGLVMIYLMGPARQLATFADQLGRQNFLGALDPARFQGELGPIAENLMALSTSMQAMIAGLEQSVIERTRELEQRAVQLRATADVGKSITTFRNLNELLQQTTLLIHERFGYYHVGIFLLDERKEYAVLSASNSEGGRKMLERNHRLKVGETGIVGFVTEQAQARIALDVGQDAAFLDNPDLPNTRSEMALPLVASGQILGALDVQSTEAQAFHEEDIATLQSLADQIAVAIQNVNLLNETEKALDAARQVYGEVSREAWRKLLRYQPRVGYLATTPGTVQTKSEVMEPGMSKAFETGDIVFGNDGLTVHLPIRVRGEAIGAIRLKKSEIAEAWTQEETNLAAALAEQLSGALESARLYRESQQRAARESLVSDIGARISASARAEGIMRETVQELGQAIGNANITFKLKAPTEEEKQARASTRAQVITRKNGKAAGS